MKNRERFIQGFLTLALILASPMRAESVGLDLGEPFGRRDRPALGASHAPVTVIEIRSFRCNHCEIFHEEVFPAIRREYVDTDRIRWVMLDADDGAGRPTIFEVARAAQAAGVYWELNEFLFAYALRSPSAIYSAVEQSDLPGRGRILAELRDGSPRADAAMDLIEARNLEITHLPTFLLRRRQSDGSFIETRLETRLDIDAFRAALDTFLAAETAE